MKKISYLLTVLLTVALLSVSSTVLATPGAVETDDVPYSEYIRESETEEKNTQAELSASVIVSGTCGENLTWSLDDEGTLTISGTGKMNDYWYKSPWGSSYCRERIKKTVVNNGVTSIGNYAFNNSGNLVSITIPSSVTSIGEYAFRECVSLTSITIPDGVTSISKWAFYNCSNLTSVTIPNSVTSIGECAFYGCYRLASATLPNSVMNIGEHAFYGCGSITSITIPNGVTSIGGGAFYYCESLTSITIPDSVTSIGDYAFYYCKSLTSITIPDSVTSIGEEAFRGCDSLTSITIPNSVMSIDNRAFADCRSLTSINVDENNKNFCSIDGNLFNKEKNRLIQYATGKSDMQYNIPDNVTSIGEDAFLGCSDSLTCIIIPESVTSIVDYAFRLCNRLDSIIIPSSVTSIGEHAFDSSRNVTIYGNSGSYAETYAKENSIPFGEIKYFYGNVIPIIHHRSIDEIVKKAGEFPHSAFIGQTTRYKETPSFEKPYSAGSLNDDDIKDAENAVKMVRYLAGVPYENVCFREDLNNIAQHGAVLLAASNQFSHYPTQPDDMDDEFYSLGYQGCREANIYAGISNISYAVLGFVEDGGSNNIERAGHRRWVLNPGNQNFGIGYARNANASYSGYRVNMQVFDGKGPRDCQSDSYIAWPSAGYFPIQYFSGSNYLPDSGVTISSPWSINLGDPYAVPDKEDVILKLIRERDNKVWIFNADTPNLGEEGLSNDKMHLAVDNDGYGIIKAIIFRPDMNSLGKIKDGDKFTVILSGIKTKAGKDTTLEYNINFFDLEKEMNRRGVTFKVNHNGKSVENAKITIDGAEFYTDKNGEAYVRVNKNEKIAYSVQKDNYKISSGVIDIENEIEVINIDLQILEKMLVNDDGNLYYVSTDKEKIVIPKEIDGIKVVSIASNVFDDCDNLKELTLLENIVSIDGNLAGKLKSIKLYVKNNSAAHLFAQKNKIPFEIIAYLSGDLDNDGRISDSDAIYLMYYTFFPDQYPTSQNCDFNNDGEVNDEDAIYLMYHTFFPEEYPLST